MLWVILVKPPWTHRPIPKSVIDIASFTFLLGKSVFGWGDAELHASIWEMWLTLLLIRWKAVFKTEKYTVWLFISQDEDMLYRFFSWLSRRRDLLDTVAVLAQVVFSSSQISVLVGESLWNVFCEICMVEKAIYF